MGWHDGGVVGWTQASATEGIKSNVGAVLPAIAVDQPALCWLTLRYRRQASSYRGFLAGQGGLGGYDVAGDDDGLVVEVDIAIA